MAAAGGGLMRTGSRRRWILWRVLRSGLLRPRVLLALAAAVRASGTNLVALARFGAAMGGLGAMLRDDRDCVALRDLAADAERLAAMLRQEYGIAAGRPVAILGTNGVGLVRCLLAVSRLGAHAILIDPHLPATQIGQLLGRHRTTVVLAPDGTYLPAGDGWIVCDPATLLSRGAEAGQVPRIGGGQIVVLTGGTTGLPKAAPRDGAPAGVLRLFLHLIATLGLDRRHAVYVAVPLFHGFGLSALLIAMALGRTIHLTHRFDADTAAALITGDGIDTLVVVPTILQRLLPHLEGTPLRCIVSGGAPLPPPLARTVRARLGGVLFNLYGTSEVGLCALATPEDLAAAPDTIGRPMWGADVSIRGADGAPIAADRVGELFVRNRASVAPERWTATGDLAHRDLHGRLFLHGRADDMIVSGGENVSPAEVEAVLLDHPDIADAAAVGVDDADFGQRLIAFAVPHAGSRLDADVLFAWLAPLVARHQMPRAIAIVEALPLIAIGKVDRRRLAKRAAS